MPQPSLRRFIVIASLFLCFVTSSAAESLKITSNPSGASVELDGVVVGTTPFEKSFPGGYFHRTHSTLGQRLEHPLVARVSLAGYATREMQLTDGPMEWIDLHGHNHGQYWLLSPTISTRISIPLRPPSRGVSLLQTPRRLHSCGQSYPWKKRYAAPSPPSSV